MQNRIQGDYFNERMEQLGVNDLNNIITIHDPEAEFPAPKTQQMPIFSEGEEGSIKILITDIRAQVRYIDVSKSTKRLVECIRLAPHLVKGDNKYKMPKGDGIQSFYPPLIQKLFKNATETKTLVITEGFFKAWKAADIGVPCIGLGSISHYREGETLVKGIVEFIQTCKVQNLVILWDGDCMDISVKSIGSAYEDLTKRPNGFFKNAANIRKLAQKIELEEDHSLSIIFKYIRSAVDPKEQPKGIDDLIWCFENNAAELEALKQELLSKKQKADRFFKDRNITSSVNKLRQDFALNDVNVFYNRHSDQICEHPFLFFGDKYEIDDEGNPNLIAPDWAREMKWIGDEFFVLRDVPTGRDNETQRRLLKRQKDSLKLRYGSKFYEYLDYYEGFCCVPNHFEYQIEQNGFYNRYFPFRWKPAEGSCENILNLYKHIFGDRTVERNGKTYTAWEMGLDYTQIMLTNPMHPLPVICLYSPENATGKSTFQRFHNWLFGDNAVGISNADLRSEFNEVFADKLVAYCEETLLDRKKDAEFIKALADRPTIVVNPKGQRQFQIPFFCKFIFSSNNRRMIYLTKHDERFWFIRVHPIKEKDPTIEAKIKKEIPAFLHFLQNRQIHTQQESRMWMHPDLYRTQEFYEAVGDNISGDAAQIKETIREMFLDFDVTELQIPLADVMTLSFGHAKDKRWIKEQLRDVLEVDQLRDKNGKLAPLKRGSYPVWDYMTNIENGESEKTKVLKKYIGRPYVFHRKDFVEADLLEIPTDDRTHEEKANDLPF